ncbi:MAG TPA: ABC transporter permease [Vicinamibacterales bacterium]|nr:ABC transporter permease [Vicinamibacterales bacterium]
MNAMPRPLSGLPDRAYRVALLLYPRTFRDRFGDEMVGFFRAQRQAAAARGAISLARFWRRSVTDLARSVWRERGVLGAMAAGPRSLFAGAAANIRDAFHFLRRSPGLGAAIVLLMAVTIGAATSIFSVVNAVLIRPLPFGQPDRLVMVWETRPERQVTRNVVSGHEFPMWQERNRVFERMAALTFGVATLTGAGEPAALTGIRVTAGFFDVMGVQPAIGRAFRAEEDTPGLGQVVILSDGLWRERFGADARVLGQTIRLNEQPFQVVGVMPEGFSFPSGPAAARPGFWSPIAEPIHLYRGRHYLHVVGRLKRDATIDDARADMARVAQSVTTDLPDLNRGHETTVVGLQSDLARDARPSLLLLLGAVSCLLLVGCSNVAGLLLARGLARSREIGVRLALGAGRLGISRQLLTEGLVLAFIGAGLGIAVTVALTRVVPRVVPREILPIDRVGVDGTVLLFTLAATLLTGVLFGLAPILQIRRIDLSTVLKQGQRTIASPGHPRVRHALVVGQIALTLLLVLGAALMTRALISLVRVDPGFTTQGILAVDLSLPGARYASPGAQRQFFDEVVARTAAVPGVVSAAATSQVPIGGGFSGISITIDGRPAPPPGQDESARYRVVSAGYFKTMGIPVIAGRTFAPADARISVPFIRWFPQQPMPAGHDRPQTAPVVVINQVMARRFWPDGNPVGGRIRALLSPWIDVIGVVADTHNASLRELPVPEFYLHDLQEPQSIMSLLVRTTGDPVALAPAIRSTIWNLDPDLAITSIRTMEDVVDHLFGLPRLTSSLLATFALIALALMAAGIYGLMAFTTRQRLPEIGVRLALGADRRQISRMVMRHALMLAAVGITIGVAVAAGLVGIARREFFGVQPIDPITWGVVGAVLLGSTVLACWWPARRASRVDPALVLRSN